MKNTEDSLNSRLRLFSIFVFFILIASFTEISLSKSPKIFQSGQPLYRLKEARYLIEKQIRRWF